MSRFEFLKDNDVMLAKLGGPRQMRALLRLANATRREIERDFNLVIRKQVAHLIKDDGESLLMCDFAIGFTWECEKSPIGLCIYNSYKDGAHDFCLICGDPEERK